MIQGIPSEGDQTNLKLDDGAAYFSILSYQHKIYLYYRGLRHATSQTNYCYSDDGLVFSEPQIVWQDSYACHNFFAFPDPKVGLRGLGGQICPGRKEHHCKGLYSFFSPTGRYWLEDGRVVSPGHPGYLNAIDIWGKPTELDGHLCCLYDDKNEQYYLYLRANPSRGVRHIQCATAKKFGHFGSFKLLDIHGFDFENDNYYSPNFVKIKNIFIGFVPFVNAQICCIRILVSKDGFVWTPKGDLFSSDPWMDVSSKQYKNRDHAVNGVIISGEELWLYVHHNYLRFDRNKPVEIRRYRFNLVDILFSSWQG